MAAVQDGQVPDDYVAGAIEFYDGLHDCITSAIDAGRENIECEWTHVADMVWARYDVEDMLDVLNALLELPRWD